MWPDRRIIDLVGIDNPDSNGGTNDGPRRERVQGSSACGRALGIKRPPVRYMKVEVAKPTEV